MLPAPPYRKALIVANPVSGQGRGKSAGAELREGLGLQGLPTELHLTQRSQDARARVQALEEEIDLVVSVGGDGTLREVLTGLRERPADAPPVRVGVLPMGTGNALCADLGLPRDVDRALEVLLGGKTVEMDVADVNGELSFLVTGVGPDALVVEDVDEHRKGRSLSKWAYLPSSLRSLWRYRREPLTVELDGETALIGEIYLERPARLRRGRWPRSVPSRWPTTPPASRSSGSSIPTPRGRGRSRSARTARRCGWRGRAAGAARARGRRPGPIA